MKQLFTSLCLRLAASSPSTIGVRKTAYQEEVSYWAVACVRNMIERFSLNQAVVGQLPNSIFPMPCSPANDWRKLERLYIPVVVRSVAWLFAGKWQCNTVGWGISIVQVIQSFLRDGQTIKFSGTHLEHNVKHIWDTMWDTSWTKLEHIWELPWTYLGLIWGISGTYLGLIWNKSRIYLGLLWGILYIWVKLGYI